MIISLAGNQWAGKSTVGELLSQKLDYPKYSTGDFMRNLAKERNMSITELNQYSETDGGEIDRILDERQQTLGENEDNFIIDGRLAFHFIPHSCKVFLDVDPKVWAKRIYEDQDELRSQTDKHETLEKAAEDITKRRESERKRYIEYYGIDNHNMDNYDLVIDTSNKTPEEVTNIIYSHIKTV